jgi:hypothetical protein
MKLLSVNVGLPRDVDWRGKTVWTSIFKAPVPGRVRVAKLNVEGDQQSDLSVHGGAEKAVYAYPRARGDRSCARRSDPPRASHPPHAEVNQGARRAGFAGPRQVHAGRPQTGRPFVVRFFG